MKAININRCKQAVFNWWRCMMQSACKIERYAFVWRWSMAGLNIPGAKVEITPRTGARNLDGGLYWGHSAPSGHSLESFSSCVCFLFLYSWQRGIYCYQECNKLEEYVIMRLGFRSIPLNSLSEYRKKTSLDRIISHATRR